MILDPNNISMAYRCASCGKTIYGMTGALALSGDMIRLKCDCGESDLTMKNIPESKLRVSVPCIFCQKDHTFVISKSLLYSKDLFTYPCPYTGIDITFFGKKDKVDEAVKESDESLTELLTDEEREALEAMESGDFPESDEHIRDMIFFTLNEIAYEHGIKCECGEPQGIDIFDGEDYVEISCKTCGCKKRFYCVSDIQTNELFEADSITLTK